MPGISRRLTEHMSCLLEQAKHSGTGAALGRENWSAGGCWAELKPCRRDFLSPLNWDSTPRTTATLEILYALHGIPLFMNLIEGGPSQYFNLAAFMVPSNGTYGNVGRDVLIGPGLASLDLSLMKNTSLSERVSLQFRAEFFNILNRANFNTPNAVVFSSATASPSATAGVINSTSTSSRQIQFGLKLIW